MAPNCAYLFLHLASWLRCISYNLLHHPRLDSMNLFSLVIAASTWHSWCAFSLPAFAWTSLRLSHFSGLCKFPQPHPGQGCSWGCVRLHWPLFALGHILCFLLFTTAGATSRLNSKCELWPPSLDIQWSPFGDDSFATLAFVEWRCKERAEGFVLGGSQRSQVCHILLPKPCWAEARSQAI